MTPRDMVLTPCGLRFEGRLYPCSIGKTGITDHKAEGDGATPRGTHVIVGMLFRPDRLLRPAPWATPIRPRDLWSDDPEAAEYNHPVKAPYLPSHEKLRRPDPLYDLVLLTDWNYPAAIPGRGSAIFVHQWRRPGYPTEGCVALSRAHLHYIAARLVPGDRLIVG